jgi:pimeloyl-ACP methyl ester carboxylesterase
VAADAQRSIEMIIERCESDPGCNAEFPNLKQSFQSLITRLDRAPVEVELDHPIDGEPTRLVLTKQIFANTIHFMSYTPEITSLIPLMVQAAYERDDFQPIAAQYLSSTALVAESISAGMRFSVICAEDVPFYDDESASDGYLGDFIVETFRAACESWPRGEIPANFKEAVNSEIPALLISGEADPVTPPSNGAQAAEHLPNSLHLVAPGMGHINLFRGCIHRLAFDFIEAGSAEGLDTSCVEAIDPMPFFTNFNGPQP